MLRAHAHRPARLDEASERVFFPFPLPNSFN
jgi:hypothetical protein